MRRMPSVIKSEIKRMLSSHPRYTAGQIEKKVEPYEYVSFDVFDTLIKRDVAAPHDIFAASAARFVKEGHTDFNTEKFKQDRIEAERTARKDAQKKGCEEVTLLEIYNRLPEQYENMRTRLLELEIEQEKTCCHANPILQVVFQKCSSHGKSIYLISDMYLPSDAVEEILDNCGYKGYRHLFISSEVGMTKKSGNLYKHVIATLGIPPKALIHIGDNPVTDYICAKKHGIKAALIAQRQELTRFTRKSLLANRKSIRNMQVLMNNAIDPGWDKYFLLGFEVLGPLLYGFCKWLHEDAKNSGIEKLFFLSRDGHLMQRAYQRLYGDACIENVYLYVSRRSLIVPSICINSDLQNVLSMFAPLRNWDCQSFCEMMGVDLCSGMRAWTACGLNEDQNFTTQSMHGNKRIGVFYNEIKQEILEKSQEAISDVSDYLKQNGFVGKIGIVDIGWRGNLQKNLEKIVQYTNIGAAIKGYYIGLSAKAKTTLNAKAYIRQDDPQSGCAGLIEIMFPPPEGTTKSYAREQGRISPVLYPYEHEGQEEKEIISAVQLGAMRFIETMCKNEMTYCFDDDAACLNLKMLCNKPRKSDVELLGGLCFCDNGMYYLANPRPLRHYLVHPKQFMHDFTKNSKWRIGFLKRLFLVPLPYSWAYRRIDRLLG